MIDVLRESPILLLFVVIALGYPLGRLKIAGLSLGVAAVLFVGIAVGSLHPELKLPELVYILGLSLFVYTVGLSSGGSFFASLRKQGLRYNLLALVCIAFGLGLTVVLRSSLGLKPTMAAGMFAGSLTNTPALANILEFLKHHSVGQNLAVPLQIILAEPVVAYSLCYPVGVVGMIFAMNIAQRLWKIAFTAERNNDAADDRLRNATIRILRPPARKTLEQLREEQGWNAVFVRVRQGKRLRLAEGDTLLEHGDRVSVVAAAEVLERIAETLGEMTDEHLEYDRSALDFRRIFVSRRSLVGKTIADLRLDEQFGAVITRVRRGDADLLAVPTMELHLGDRIRVVAPTERMNDLTVFFGDSYKALSEIDLMTFGLGIAAGLLLGLIPFPMPGGETFRLGFAGGPLIVGLVLGYWGRTGTLVWDMPFSANLLVRQLGLALFLAGVGTRSGYAFVSTFLQQGGLGIFAAGALITCSVAVLALLLGRFVFAIPFDRLMGVIAGMQTQPALLGYATEQTSNDEPSIGYTTVYPVATIVKILFAQLLLTSL
ncbi:MAG: transporter [Candidatus Kapabacteria bacterium]|nr:transporter [Candidatus Kapabacteria bacterium]